MGPRFPLVSTKPAAGGGRRPRGGREGGREGGRGVRRIHDIAPQVPSLKLVEEDGLGREGGREGRGGEEKCI